MKWQVINLPISCLGMSVFIWNCGHILAQDAAAYDPSSMEELPLPAAAVGQDKSLLQEPCLAVVEEFDDEPDLSRSDNAMVDNKKDSWLYCETPGGYFYRVPATDPEWIETMVDGGTLVSGVTELNLPPDTLINQQLGTLEWNNDDVVAPELFMDAATNYTKRRRLVQVTGTKTVLAVRVTALDEQNTFDEATLRNEVFGAENTNLKTQFAKCSFGQLIFVPADDRRGTTLSIVGGVVTVNVNHFTTEGDSVLRNAVTTKLKEDFGVENPSELADHVMYCLPPRTMAGIAYAYINSWLSVFSDKWGLYVSAQMHEIGHNLNLAHANDFKFLSHDRARSEYDDKTGLMGYSYGDKEFPKMCFNPAKSWQLKWYRNKEVSYVPTCDQVTMKVGGIIDYQNAEVDTVLLQFNQLSKSEDYYLTYNARASFNRETQEGGNKVVIDAQGGNGAFYSTSTLEALLEVGESFEMLDFNDVSGDKVVVSFDQRGGSNNREAIITIVWIPNDTSICETSNPTSAPMQRVTPDPTSAPTQSPTFGPMALPTNRPTRSPTKIPSSTPTLTPSGGPSPRPSSIPSSVPTPNPTLTPTGRPTRVSSSIPTNDPSLTPTITASDNPTSEPTKRPTTMPTKSPTFEPTMPPSQLPTTNPPTRTPTTRPTASPTTKRRGPPSESPSRAPTLSPTRLESDVPSKDPTRAPTNTPSAGPTFKPTVSPSKSPTMDPTARPSAMPSRGPTSTPTLTPSEFPTFFPTSGPTWMPSEEPTDRPSVSPSFLPTFKPSCNPSFIPTPLPTMTPSSMPSKPPSSNPTFSPSIPPTREPTPAPTLRPTVSPPPVANPDCKRWYWFMIPDCMDLSI